MAETFFDKIYKNKTLHTPDVLSCLANLSNDEVFTPPDIANKMLDLLPHFFGPCLQNGRVFARDSQTADCGLAGRFSEFAGAPGPHIP